MKIIIICVISVFIISSCNIDDHSGKDNYPVARVLDSYLYFRDLKSKMPDGLSPKDSAVFAKEYIDKWIKKQLLLKKADMNLTPGEKDVEQKVDDYRSSLLIFKYQQKLLAQQLDTNITDQDIYDYYKTHCGEFILKGNIIKPAFIKVPRSAPRHWRVKYWYTSGNEEDVYRLEEYCLQYADKFSLKDEWIFFNRLQEEIPARIDNQEQYLRYNKFYETYDSIYYYFIDFKEYKLAGDTTPVDLIKEDITGILLNKRKMQFIKDMGNNLFQDALNKQKIEYYDKK